MSKRKAAGGSGSGLPQRWRRRRISPAEQARERRYEHYLRVRRQERAFRAYGEMLREDAPASTEMTHLNRTVARDGYRHHNQRLMQNRTTRATLQNFQPGAPGRRASLPPEMIRMIGEYIVGPEAEIENLTQLGPYGAHGPMTPTEIMMLSGAASGSNRIGANMEWEYENPVPYPAGEIFPNRAARGNFSRPRGSMYREL